MYSSHVGSGHPVSVPVLAFALCPYAQFADEGEDQLWVQLRKIDIPHIALALPIDAAQHPVWAAPPLA